MTIVDQLAEALREARQALSVVESEAETSYPATVMAAISTIDEALAAHDAEQGGRCLLCPVASGMYGLGRLHSPRLSF